MQWLINLVAERVIAEIGIPPVFIDRGDPAAHDFTRVNFTADGGFHDLDISAIVPAVASCVLFNIEAQANEIGKVVVFRAHGNVNQINTNRVKTQVAGIAIYGRFSVPMDGSQKIVYATSAFAWTTLNVTPIGWWL